MSSSVTPRSRESTTLTDAEWLQSLAVAMPEPANWHAALKRGHLPSVAKQLRRRLGEFSGLKLLATVRWSCDAQVDSLTIDALDELLHLQSRKKRQLEELSSGMVEAWLDRQSAVVIPTLSDQLLASWVLVEYSNAVSDAMLIRLWRFVEERTGQMVQPHHTAPTPLQDLLHLEQQMLRMLAGSCQPPGKSELGPVAQGVREFLERWTDEKGMPFAEIHAILAGVTACLLRIESVAQKLEIPLLKKPLQNRLRGLARSAVLLAPIDSSSVPSRTPHEAYSWLSRVSEQYDLSEEDAIARLLRFWKDAGLERSPRPTKPSRVALKKKQLISHQSDQSHYALMHGDWRESRDHCLVRFDGATPQLDASLLEKTFLSGDWALQLSIDGESLVAKDWSCSCWFSDSDADFCEFKSELSADVTVYRQLLWARRDRFLVVADEVRAPGQQHLRVDTRLALASGWNALADGRTREWQLQQGDDIVRVYPIFQPQQRVHKSEDRLTCTAGEINQVITMESEGLYSALILDWDPGRRTSPIRWSPLTIMEDRQRMAPHVACGARWSMGQDVWLVYHQSSKGDTARSVLGLHTHHETVITKLRNGNYERLVEVES